MGFVEPDLTIKGQPEILVIGDLAHCADSHGQPLPALSPVAIQQGRYTAALIRGRLDGRSLPPFRCKDRGPVSTSGRGIAVVDLKKLRFGGWSGWLTWLFIHLLHVEPFEHRLLILIHGRGITSRAIDPRGLITGNSEVDAHNEVRPAPQRPTLVAPAQPS